MNHLALTYRSQGRYVEATKIQEKVLEKRTGYWEKTYSASMHDLAWSISRSGESRGCGKYSRGSVG